MTAGLAACRSCFFDQRFLLRLVVRPRHGAGADGDARAPVVVEGAVLRLGRGTDRYAEGDDRKREELGRHCNPEGRVVVSGAACICTQSAASTTAAFAVLGELAELFELGVGQRDVHACDVFFQMLDLAGAGDWQHDGTAP